ncbi:MAG: pantoate--beta-alanine ligase [Phycisphaerae bacterium]|nr:pantoate--beta-alanine ligase [Phycisphaerae bacterium]
MITTSDIEACRRTTDAARRAGRTIGFVPTMGGLHAGHASLIERARTDGRFVVVSIFVNPTQFGPGEDLQSYPRTPEADAARAKASGADLLFTPDGDAMYGADAGTRVRPGRLAEALCGPFRPGHFEGVCTVVAKLFHIVRPDAAYFGQKDAQQVVIVRAMVRDLRMPIEIVTCPIVREPDGLAMSTRNAYLSADERRRATALYRALQTGAERIASGERRSGKVISAMRRVLDEASPCRIDYIAIVDPGTLEDRPELGAGPVMLALAVRIGSARLIDNQIVDVP